MIEQLVSYFKQQDLTGDDIYKLIHRYPILYSDLKKYKNLKELLPPQQPYVVILYQTSSKTTGHYVALFIRNNIIHFQDSYGLKPDSEQQYAQFDKPLPRYLTQLIENDGREMQYNTFDFQSKNSDIATCGRWSALKILLRDIDDSDFRHLFYNNQTAYLTPDNLVVLLTLVGLNDINSYFEKN